jgi:hypothetical protein
MTNATDRAIAAFRQFTEAWIGPAAHESLYASGAAEAVQAAIRAIAPAEAKPTVGYVVFGLQPETRERRRESGFELIPVSAVFDELAQAENAYNGSTKGMPWQRGIRDGMAGFILCSVQQIRG